MYYSIYMYERRQRLPDDLKESSLLRSMGEKLIKAVFDSDYKLCWIKKDDGASSQTKQCIRRP